MTLGDDSSFGITVVYTEYETTEGEKAIGGAVRKLATRVGSLDTERLAENLDAFCRRLGLAFANVATNLGEYELEQVEVTIEVTSRGEIRLIGSAGAEVRGGLKLVFSRVSHVP